MFASLSWDSKWSQVLGKWTRLRGWPFIGKTLLQTMNSNWLRRYYQWVNLVMFLQAACFYLPRCIYYAFVFLLKFAISYVQMCLNILHFITYLEKVFVEAIWEWNPRPPPTRTEQPSSIAGGRQSLLSFLNINLTTQHWNQERKNEQLRKVVHYLSVSEVNHWWWQI